ncbi:hypothetical protein BT63DRAFT_449527 [Microthyrium microscopicum]|uniref:Zn(2)-C6 fungal-type domain-containing protein n=1 Tax=Microthyrium microscopicum TaxID=703497 RepID=A0A6A6UQH0_9PEZI|nr:hypothetical protein BT63DRAFT_449527 [Microthyrium microscopicum]
MAVAIQPAMMPSSSPVPIASALSQAPRRPTSGKDELTLSVPKPTSSHIAGLSNIRSRRERPCDACRRRKSRCVINPGATICVLCDFHKQSCTFLQDPQPRKRKVQAASDLKDASAKKRYGPLVDLLVAAGAAQLRCICCTLGKCLVPRWLSIGCGVLCV